MPETWAERFDNARTPQEWGDTLGALFKALETAKDDDDE